MTGYLPLIQQCCSCFPNNIPPNITKKKSRECLTAYMKIQSLCEEVILSISVTGKKKSQTFKLKVLSAGHSGHKTTLMMINIKSCEYLVFQAVSPCCIYSGVQMYYVRSAAE